MAVREMQYKLQSYGQSETGLVRERNEDAWGALPELGFFVLADGMGGHKAGDVASQLTVDHLCASMKKLLEQEGVFFTNQELVKLLRLAIVEANREVYKKAQANPELKGMGTTLCCMLFHGSQVIYAHLGDSRIYRCREGLLDQLTEDHSLYRQLKNSGEIGGVRREDFRYKNIVTKCIGTGLLVDPTIQTDYVKHGDTYLMCSDGLTDMLENAEVEEIMQDCPGLEPSLNALMDAALIRGGNDNCTIVLVQAEAEDEA